MFAVSNITTGTRDAAPDTEDTAAGRDGLGENTNAAVLRGLAESIRKINTRM